MPGRDRSPEATSNTSVTHKSGACRFALTRKAEAAGDGASLIVVPATGHVELVAPGTAAFDIQAEVLGSFIGKAP